MPPLDLAEREAKLHELALERARVTDDHVWRPYIFDGMFGQQPLMESKLAPAGFLQIFWTSLPWFAQAFNTVVPDTYVAEDLNADGYSAATVACPCGEPHEVEIGTVLSAGCGRGFAWFGAHVLVASSKDSVQPAS